MILDPFQVVTAVTFPADGGSGGENGGRNVYISNISQLSTPTQHGGVFSAFSDPPVRLESFDTGDGSAFDAPDFDRTFGSGGLGRIISNTTNISGTRFNLIASLNGDDVLPVRDEIQMAFAGNSIRGTTGNFTSCANLFGSALVKVSDSGAVTVGPNLGSGTSGFTIQCADVIGVVVATQVIDPTDLETRLTQYEPVPATVDRLTSHAFNGVDNIHAGINYYNQSDQTWYNVSDGPMKGDDNVTVLTSRPQFNIGINDPATTYQATLGGDSVSVLGQGDLLATLAALDAEMNASLGPAFIMYSPWSGGIGSFRTVVNEPSISDSATGGTGTMSSVFNPGATGLALYIGPLLNGFVRVREIDRTVDISGLTVAAGSPPPLTPTNKKMTRLTMNHAPLAWSGSNGSPVVTKLTIKTAAGSSIAVIPAGATTDQLVAVPGNTDGSGNYVYLKMSNEDFPRSVDNPGGFDSSAVDQPPGGLTKINIDGDVEPLFGDRTPYQLEIRIYGAATGLSSGAVVYAVDDDEVPN